MPLKLTNVVQFTCVLLAVTCLFVPMVGAVTAQAPGLIHPEQVAQASGAEQQRLTNAPPGAVAQQPTSNTGQNEKGAPTAYITFKTPYEFWLTGLVIAVLVIMGGMLCLMAWANRLTQEFFKAFLILI